MFSVDEIRGDFFAAVAVQALCVNYSISFILVLVMQWIEKNIEIDFKKMNFLNERGQIRVCVAISGAARII